MSVISMTGQMIDELPKEDDRTKNALWLMQFKWPEDKEALWHLTWSDFKCWLYLLEPRTAMILSNDAKFVEFRERKRNKCWMDEFFSWTWRCITWG